MIRQGLRHAPRVDAGPELLGEVMHEIAEVADGLTRQCLKACFTASLRQSAAGAAVPATEGTRTSVLASQPRPSRATRLSRLDSADTRINADMLAERAQVLRQSVAAARQNGTQP